MSSNVVGEASVRIRPDARGFDGELRSSVGSSIGKIAKTAGAALVAGGLVRAISQQVGAAGSLQKSLRESVGLLGQTGKVADRTFSQFSNQVAALSREVGIAQAQISDGLYEALGAGVPRGNAIEFLRVASKAATAGVTDLATTVDGLTTVINAYGLKASDAQMVSDSLFQTVNAGKATFDELSRSLFNVAPIAASAGVDLQTVGAALATLTAGGVPAAEATTQLRAAIQAIVAPSVRAEKQLAPVFKNAGYESGQAALKALGFQKTIELISTAAGGSSTKLTRMLGTVEGLNAVLTLTGKGSGLFSEELKNQANAAGVTDKALGQIEKSAGRSFERARNAAQNFGLAVGDAAAPAVARLADQLTSGLNRISGDAGFRNAVLGIADSISGGLTDPRTLASLQQFGQTGVAVLGTVRASAQATSPAIEQVARALGAVASSNAGPAILLTAASYAILARGLNVVTPRLQAYRQAQAQAAAAQAASAAATRTAALQSVSAIGLIGPSSLRATTTATTGLGRVAGAARIAGSGLLGLAGGPMGAAVLGVSALAAGAFLLSQRQSNAARQSAEFAASLRDQAAAANEATAALERQRSAVTAIAGGRVAIDEARNRRGEASAEVSRIQAAPASDFGGEAGKRDALAQATNRLRLAEAQLNDARRQGAVLDQKAVQTSNAAQAASAKRVADAQRAAQAFGQFNVQQIKVAVGSGLNAKAAIGYTAAQQNLLRAQAQSVRGYTESATQARNAARQVDTSTAAGKRNAAQLRAEATESTRKAEATRKAAVETARGAIESARAIASSKGATAAQRKAAQAQVDFATKLVGQLRAKGAEAGKAAGEGIARGAKASEGKAREAGKAGGEAVATGAQTTAPAANAAGLVVGQNIGLGVVTGINAQIPSAYAAGLALGKAGADGAAAGAQTKSPSRLTAKTGQDLGRGLVVGAKSEQGRTAQGVAATVRAAVTAAGQVGIRNARVQGNLTARAMAEGFKVTGPTFAGTIKTTVSAALRDSILAARSNLESFGQNLASLAARAIDAGAPSFAGQDAALRGRSDALDAASAADQERQLRNAVALAEAGQGNAQKRYQALLAAQAKRTPEQAAKLSPLQRERERQRIEEARLAAEDPARAQRLELERFLLSQDQTRVDREREAAQAATEARKAALDQQFADLVANLSAGRIKVDEFNAGITASLAANGVNIGAVGAQLGSAFLDSFNLATGQLFGQAKALGLSPALPSGFIAGIERPAAVALAEAVTTRNVLRQSFATELERVRQSQANARAALQETFRKEGSAGRSKITEAEQKQLNAQAAQHREQLRELRALQTAFTNAPPQTVIDSIVVAAPGTDPTVIGNAIARALSQRTATAARR